jgi:DNA-binding Lrp family transcriptional regulator
VDETDRRLLKALGQEFQPSCRDLSSRLGISPSAVHKRLQLLSSRGIAASVALVPNPQFFDALEVMIFGRSGLPSIEPALRALGRSPCTSRVVAAGGNELYVSAVIPGLRELDRYAEFVRREAGAPDALVGILRPAVHSPQSGPGLSRLDFRILRALRDDCRKRLADVAGELGVSSKTVARRVRGLLERGAASPRMSLDLERAGDILAIMRVRLREGRKPGMFPPAGLRQSAGLLGFTSFTNIPEWTVLLAWAGGLGELLKQKQRLDSSADVEFSVLNLAWKMVDHITWLDKGVARWAETGPEARSGLRRRRAPVEVDVVTRLDTYRRALTQALEDGVITDDEEAILRALRDSLGITDDEHSQLVKILRHQQRGR